MATMSLEAILERVQDLRMETDEKDEVIRVQQGQINDLEGKIQQLEATCKELEEKANELADSNGRAEELLEKLSQMLG